MKSYGQALDLVNDPEIIEKYKEYHRNVWPEVVASLKEIGITTMKIYLTGNHLFMYFESVNDFDPERDFQSYTQKNPRANEWNDLMSAFQQKVPEASESDWWAPAELVYDLDW
jgi:L-rhamnose mutarotase